MLGSGQDLKLVLCWASGRILSWFCAGLQAGSEVGFVLGSEQDLKMVLCWASGRILSSFCAGLQSGSEAGFVLGSRQGIQDLQSIVCRVSQDVGSWIGPL